MNPTLDSRARFEAWYANKCGTGLDLTLHRRDAESPAEYHHWEEQDAWEAWQAAIASRAAPEGWVLVPPTPTEEMHIAAVRTIVRCNGNDEFPGRVWRAMLAAAPTPQDPPIAAPSRKETT